ncbi:endonuclease-8 [Rhodococcus sp. OK611]|uniref:Fpg/Nei family DNA glycosylase n=1 Tax=unclassified Rhodococcus (in: high G+C Gram-positive bacteria) TaxID=192944 RepID=UPI000BD02234|nr:MULTISPECIES: DNA-formamidopyrimidine glycosylase family protein [unclassified Rhodococcus (in: high G+C Gram-positive bacteria)]PTR43516.1 endonuclease-8 [Rhodococcus sp. OK611]SNX90861.1 endonuclease-8 [Rhodococcus sp. OK270]
MPEGHTLHRLAREHQRHFAGAPVRVSSPQGRFESGAASVDGRVLVRAEAWGKHLLHHYESGQIVHVHLGLYGKFTDLPLPMGTPVGQVRMRMVGAEIGTDLRGPTACEIYDEPQLRALEDRLGPDPLRPDADPARAWRRISKSQTAIGALLMDQQVIAGVGNVYRAELLFRHGINPNRPGARLGATEWDAMWTDLVALMKVGVRRGKMHVVRPEHDNGEPAYAKDRPRTYVYRRTGSACRVCGTPIAHSVMKARNLFWCPTCQSV